MSSPLLRALLLASLIGLASPAWAQWTGAGGDPPPLDTEPAPQAKWTAWGGAIFLTRSGPSSQPIVEQGGSTLLNADQLSFSTQTGPDLNLLRRGEWLDLDLRYFQVDNMSASATLTPVGAIDILVDPLATLTCPRFDAIYDSSLLSAESNARKNVTQWISLLAGFRYVQLRDRLQLQPDPLHQDPSLANGDFRGTNNLYGFQIGADAIAWTFGRFQLQTAVKAGVYCNNAENSITFNNEGQADIKLLQVQKQHTAFVGDWNCSGMFQITPHCAVRGGYQLLWLSGVALASDQLTTHEIVTSGDVFFHGALASVELNW